MTIEPLRQLEAQNRLLRELARQPGMDDAALDRMLDEVCRTSAGLLDVDRVGVWVFSADRALIACLALFDRRDGAIGRGQTLEARRYPAYFAALEADEPVPAGDARAHPATAGLGADYLEPMGLGALLDTPVRVEQALAGVLCHEHPGAARPWRDDEIRAASALADVAGMVLEMRGRWEAEGQSRRLAALVESSPDAVYTLTPDHRVQSWGSGAARLFGYSAGEAFGSDPAVLVRAGPPTTEKAAREALSAGDGWQGEGTRRTRDGRDLTVLSRRTVLRDVRGRAEAILMVETDLTESRRLEAELIRSRRLESVGLLAAGVAHEMNNVLTPILTAVALLRGDPDGEDRSEMLRELERGVLRGAGMLRQLLAYARGNGEGHRSPVQLGPLVRDAAKLLGQIFPKTILIRVEMPPRPPVASANAVQVQQVLTHLALNARDAMPSGGPLILRLREVRLGPGPPGAPAAGRYAALEVEDSGVGIGPEEMARVFDPFYTTKPAGGTGLGLSAAWGIVRAHGGTLTLRSEPGRGTTVTALFPLAETGVEPERRESPADAPRGRGELIILADDDATIRELSAELLRRHGYEVAVARDGAEAVGLFSLRRSEVGCVILDARMPVLDGRAALRTVRAIDPLARVIMTSAVRGDLDPPVAAVLPKPYPAALLLEAVHAVIAGLPAPRLEAD